MRIVLPALALAVALTAAPAQASAFEWTGEVDCGTLPEPFSCSYGGAICVRSTCPEETDPNNICHRQYCVTGVYDNVAYLVNDLWMKVDEAAALALGVAATALEKAGAVRDEVDRILDEGVCVEAFDPENPICVSG